MIYEDGHPNTTLSDWQTFRKEFSPYLIDEVIDRSAIKLPDWFVPLARGVAIASDSLMRKARHIDGMYRPRGWRKTHYDVFRRDMHLESLLVRQYCNQGLWTIERWGVHPRYNIADELLVHNFGSTPIFTWSYQSAMRLAEYCHVNEPPAGLRWIAACPDDKERAIEFARKRSICEALAHQNARLEDHLHRVA